MRGRQRLRQLISLAMLVAVVVFSVVAIHRSWSDVASTIRRLNVLDVVLVLALALAAIFAAFLSWRSVLRGLHADMPGHEARAMFFCSQVGKYVPGSVWPAVIQTEIGARNRVPRSAVLLGYLFAMAAGLSGAGLLSGLVLADPPSGWITVGVVGAVVAGVCLAALLTHRGGARRLTDWVARRRPAPADEPTPKTTMTIQPGDGARSILFAAVGWMALSVEGVWLAYRLSPNHVGVSALVAVAGAIPFSWACGFIVLPVPAGAGIREAVLVLSIGASIGRSTAISLALVTRLATVVLDVVVALLSGLPGLIRSTRQHRQLQTVSAAAEGDAQ